MHAGQQVAGVLAFACSHSGVVSCVDALTGGCVLHHLLYLYCCTACAV
jgi:hypothetical protein